MPSRTRSARWTWMWRVYGAVCGAIIGSLAGCGSLFHVDVDIPELCQSIAPLEFDGLPAAGEATVTRSFEIDVAGHLPAGVNLATVDGELHLLRVSLQPGLDTADFNAVASASLDVAGPPGSSLPPIALVRYQRDEATEVKELHLEVDQAADLLPYARAGTLSIEAGFTGELPTQKWSAGGEACARVKVGLLGH